MASDVGNRAPLKIYFDRDHVIEATPRDTVASAMLRAGHVACTRSPKYRRVRGPYCLLGDCGTCQLRIDGHPNIRACTTIVRDGMEVASQNTFGPPGVDPTGLIDHVFSDGIDHHHMMVKPRILNQLMQVTARSLTGFGTLPDVTGTTTPTHRQLRPDVLVIGAGTSGRLIAHALEARGINVHTYDRRDRLALEVWSQQPLPKHLELEMGVIGAYPSEGNGGRVVAATSPCGEDQRLHSIYPRHIVLALGSRQPTMLLPRNDLPGVVAARGLLNMLQRTGKKLAAPVIVITRDPAGERLATRLQEHVSQPLKVIAHTDVRELVGSDRVRAVVTATGRFDCEFVALAPTPAPAHELAVMAGAAVAFDGRGFAPLTDDTGRCQTTSPVPWDLWACGSLRGAVDDHRDQATQLVEAISADIGAAGAT